jgi:hypothetical protein
MTIIYICPQYAYPVYFETFLNSLKNFFPNEEKKLLLITPHEGMLDSYQNYSKDNIQIYIKLISNLILFPLEKINLIREFKDEIDDYVFFFNPNTKIISSNSFTLSQDKLFFGHLENEGENEFGFGTFFGGKKELMNDLCTFCYQYKFNEDDAHIDETKMKHWIEQNPGKFEYINIGTIYQIQ